VQGASSSISPIGYPLQLGSNYVVQATPGSNWTFVNWTAGTQTFTSSALQITMFNGLEVTANFAPATLTPLELIIIGNGTVSPITNGEYLAFGTNFQATATPGPGEVFYGWNTGAGVFTNTTQTFTMTSNMTLTAEFISSPTQKNVISFTYPPANAKLQTNSFEVKGRIAPKFKSAQVTVQIVSTTSGYEVGPLSISGINSWSVAVTNLPPDSYVVEAVATYSNGLSTAISEKFSILDFKKVAGTYEGLFICNNDAVSPTNSGYFTCTISASGAFSGKLSFPAYKPFVIHEVFYADGVYEFSYPNFPGNPFVVYLNLNLAENNNVLSGDIFSVTSNGWYSPLVCYRAATKLSTHTTPATGKYLLKLPYGSQTNNPETNGYASLTVGAGGVLTLSGALPDGASFSQSARVSTNGVWPLYVTPTGYGVQGMLMGWENWQTNSAQGDWTGRLYWYKNANVGTYYTGGVNTNMTSTGTNYVAPLAGNYSIAFQGGTVSVPITNNLSVARNGGQFRPVDATDKLAISISGSGVLTGHFVNPADNTTLQFKGAFFGQSNGGSGFILEGSGKTGGFVIKQE
jgi:hypothetical protein